MSYTRVPRFPERLSVQHQKLRNWARFRKRLIVALAIPLIMMTVLFLTGPVQASSGVWTVVPTPNVGSVSIFYAVTAVSDQDVWAVGPSGPLYSEQTLTEHWDGSSWSIVPSPSTGALQGAAAVASNDVWAVGRTGADGSLPLTEHWDGSTWSVVPEAAQVPGSLASVAALSATDVWAVGFTGVAAANHTLIEHWDGTSWTVVASPNIPGASQNRFDGVVARASNDVWAVGAYYTGSYFTLVAHWDGVSWSVVPSPNIGANNGLLGVTAVPGGDELWAVGLYLDASGSERTLTQHWDGVSWSIIASPNDGPASNYLTGVAAISPTDIWATGKANPNARSLLEHWDGTSWTVDTSLISYEWHGLNGIALAPGATTPWVVGGYYSSCCGAVQTLAAHLTGTPVRQLTALAPAKIWIGLKNSDDVGVKFDLLAEVYKDSTLVTSGQVNSFGGGSSGFNNAHLATIAFDSFTPTDFPAGTQLSIKLHVRNACTGSTHNSGVARLWYDDTAANSQFGATIDDSDPYFLRADFVLATSIGSGPKKTVDVQSGAKCSPFKPFGTWTITP